MQARTVTHQIRYSRYARIAATVLLAVAAALTLVLAYRTFWYLFHSVTNVPYWDQWVMLDEIRHVREGQSGWSYLWSPYWGQRLLLPRLLFLLSAKYLHYWMLPFILINMTAQISMLVVLIGMVRRLFQYSSLVFWVSAIALIHLLLSSLQMEIFIESMPINYTIGYASAVAASCVLRSALDPKARFEPRFWISIVLAIVSTACLAIGLLVWPALIVEVWLSKTRRKYHLGILVALAVAVVSVYALGYTRPDMGMGFSGIIRHPISALSIVAMVLGGPVSLYSRSLGMVAGGIGIVIACGILVHFWRKRSATAPAISLIIVAWFMIGSAVSIAVGRVSPEWLASYSGQPLPSQWRMPPQWAGIWQGFDAIGSGFIISVSDQEYMSRVFPVEDYRHRLLGYMRQEHLSVFAEPRADWIGKDVATIARGASEKNCRGNITATSSLGGNPPAFRIIGTLTVDGWPPGDRLDILMADNEGRIVGLARTLPVQSEGKQATDFLGYMRCSEESASTARFFVLFPDRRSCAVRIQ